MTQPPDPIERILVFLGQFVSLGAAEQELVRKLTRVERYAKGTLPRATKSCAASPTIPRSRPCAGRWAKC
jgi:hypothetical protein